MSSRGAAIMANTDLITADMDTGVTTVDITVSTTIVPVNRYGYNSYGYGLRYRDGEQPVEESEKHLESPAPQN